MTHESPGAALRRRGFLLDGEHAPAQVPEKNLAFRLLVGDHFRLFYTVNVHTLLPFDRYAMEAW
jgi:hypothetical protein